MMVYLRSAGYASKQLTLQELKQNTRVPIYQAKIIRVFAQTLPVFVQGLDLQKETLYTSSGLYGKSFVRGSMLLSGKVMQEKKINKALFAEGITVFHHRLYQLFWKAHKGYIYDLPSLKKMGQFPVIGEGWGLTHDKRYLIMSNGSSNLLYLNPKKHFRVAKRLAVHTSWTEVGHLNALCFYHHVIYANIWFLDAIAMISPSNGKVLGWIDLSALHPKKSSLSAQCAAANGVSVDRKTGRLVVTGKCWDRLYEIRYRQSVLP